MLGDSDLRFRIQLQGPLPSIDNPKAGTLSIRFSFCREKRLFRWQWLPYTPILDVYADIAVLLEVPCNELSFDFPEDAPIIRHYFQLINIKKKGPLWVTRKSCPVTLTLVHGDLRKDV